MEINPRNHDSSINGVETNRPRDHRVSAFVHASVSPISTETPRLRCYVQTLRPNSANVARCLAVVYPACKRNDTAFAGVIDTSYYGRSTIDPLVNYRESLGTDHRCGDTVTGHRSIPPSCFLPSGGPCEFSTSLSFVPVSCSFSIAFIATSFTSFPTFFCVTYAAVTRARVLLDWTAPDDV